MTEDMEMMDCPHDAFVTRPITRDIEDMRVCRNLIFKCHYRPLYAIESQAQFHQVFIHAIRAHYQAYTAAQVLHRDINMNNIMWYKCGGEVVGVLCDFDTAEDDSIDGHMESRYRTGTAAPDPYMAIDLLATDPPPPHKYRHDLESFFYLYVCAAATFDPDSEQKIRVVPQWEHPSPSAAGLLKKQFLRSKAEYHAVLKHAPAPFQRAVGGVLRDLWLLFVKVEYLAHQASMAAILSEDTGESPEVVQRELDGLEHQRDELASYANFMEILEVPSHEL